MDQNDEALSERKKTYDEAVERKRLFNELKENPAFRLFCKELSTQIDRRVTELLGFPAKLDKIVQNTYTSGEIAGIKLALEFVDSLIDYAQASIDVEKAFQMREENRSEIEEPNNNG